MKIILTRILTTVFFMLSIIHFYWAFVGQWGLKNALPTNQQGIRILNPTTTDCIIVGIVLFVFGLLYLFSLQTFKNKTLIIIRNIGLWVIPILFMIRAVGDLKYVGFFKQINGTVFAKMDTNFYSPLCLTIGLIGLMVISIKRSS